MRQRPLALASSVRQSVDHAAAPRSCAAGTGCSRSSRRRRSAARCAGCPARPPRPLRAAPAPTSDVGLGRHRGQELAAPIPVCSRAWSAVVTSSGVPSALQRRRHAGAGPAAGRQHRHAACCSRRQRLQPIGSGRSIATTMRADLAARRPAPRPRAPAWSGRRSRSAPCGVTPAYSATGSPPGPRAGQHQGGQAGHCTHGRTSRRRGRSCRRSAPSASMMWRIGRLSSRIQDISTCLQRPWRAAPCACCR